MAKDIKKFTILIASPSDVADERESIQEVLSELNRTYGRRSNLIIDAIKWETDTAPAATVFGDSQDVIDKDLGDEYDLFIGFIWKKFGTSTHQYGSGTEQEFRKAHKRFLDNPGSLQILFYFKTAPISIYEIDPDQITKIVDFRKDLGEKGIYYWEYNTVDELHKFLRIHIPLRIDELLKSGEALQTNEDSTTIIESIAITDIKDQYEIPIDEEELGVVDYLEIMEDAFAAATEALERISNATTIVGTEITKKADELNSLNSRGNSIGNKVLRDFFRRTAVVMDDFSSRIEPEIPIYHTHFEIGTDAVAKLTAIYRSDDDDRWDVQIEEAKTAIGVLLDGLHNGLTGMESFLQTINTLPRMEKELNRARRRSETILQDLVSSLGVTYAISNELYKDLTD